MERVKGVEPSQPAWKAGALPLSYTRKKRWSGKRDSNSRPPPWQGGALATELLPHMVDESGFEPLKAKLTDLQSVPFGQLGYSSILKTLVKINGAGDRTWTHNLLITSQLLYRLSYTSVNIKWRPGTDSNRRPPAWQAGILTNWTTGPSSD